MNLRDVFEVKISTPLLAKGPYWDGQEKEGHFNASDSVENTGRTPRSYPIVYPNCGKKSQLVRIVFRVSVRRQRHKVTGL
jgi:hypothetical protein